MHWKVSRRLLKHTSGVSRGCFRGLLDPKGSGLTTAWSIGEFKTNFQEVVEPEKLGWWQCIAGGVLFKGRSWLWPLLVGTRWTVFIHHALSPSCFCLVMGFSNETRQRWTEGSETLSPNKSFLSCPHASDILVCGSEETLRNCLQLKLRPRPLLSPICLFKLLTRQG